MGEVADLVNGDRGKNYPSASAFVESGLAFINAGHLRDGTVDIAGMNYIPRKRFDLLSSGKVKRGDVLYCLRGSLGKAAICPLDEGAVASSLVIVRPLISNTFVFFFLISPLGMARIKEYDNGSAQPNLSAANVARYKLPLPPLNEQRRIVSKIDTLTARSRSAREALKQVSLLLERFRQSVLAAAFRGDLTAEWRRLHPDVEPVESLLARTPAPPAPRQKPAAGVIQGRAALAVNDPQTTAPPGWCWVPLGRLARLETGHTPSRGHAEYWDGDIFWVGIRDAREHHGRRIQETQQRVTQAGLDNSAARLLPEGTVCLSRTASVGYVFILGRPMATSQDFVNWVCGAALDPQFLMYLLMAEGDDIRRFGKGSTHTTIYFPEVVAFHVCLPPLEEQRRIVSVIGERLAAIDRVFISISGEGDRLATLEQSILAKAFRGELVPQDPNDEPASVLLDRVRREREAAGADGARRGRRGRGPSDKVTATATAPPEDPPTSRSSRPPHSQPTEARQSKHHRLATVLGTLRREALHRVADAEDVELADRRSLDAARSAIVGSGVGLDTVLAHLDRDELKAACRALGLEDRGRTKDELRARVLAPREATGS